MVRSKADSGMRRHAPVDSLKKANCTASFSDWSFAPIQSASSAGPRACAARTLVTPMHRRNRRPRCPRQPGRTRFARPPTCRWPIGAGCRFASGRHGTARASRVVAVRVEANELPRTFTRVCDDVSYCREHQAFSVFEKGLRGVVERERVSCVNAAVGADQGSLPGFVRHEQRLIRPVSQAWAEDAFHRWRGAASIPLPSPPLPPDTVPPEPVRIPAEDAPPTVEAAPRIPGVTRRPAALHPRRQRARHTTRPRTL